MTRSSYCIPALIVGCVFLLSGMGKVGNVLAFQRLIVEYGLGSFNVVAPFVVLLELLIGCFLVFNYHVKITSIFSIVLLIVFSIIYSYAWLHNGITDCGCFGNYSFLQTSPLFTLARNICLIILLIVTVVTYQPNTVVESWKRITICTIMFSATFVSGMTYRPFAFVKNNHPFENVPISETQLNNYSSTTSGRSELMFFISYSCPHCVNSIENYKAWQLSEIVDTTSLYIVVDSSSQSLDSLRNLFIQRFPSIQATEIDKSSLNFIEAYPTAFMVKNDTIQNVILGELPSHYLFIDDINK